MSEEKPKKLRLHKQKAFDDVVQKAVLEHGKGLNSVELAGVLLYNAIDIVLTVKMREEQKNAIKALLDRVAKNAATNKSLDA